MVLDREAEGMRRETWDLAAHARDEDDRLTVETLRERVPQSREGMLVVKAVRQQPAQVGH